jgi:hypothetical protein
MENSKYIKYLIIFLFSLILPSFCFSYSQETTHPALTQETVRVFNKHYPNLSLSDKETSLVMKGSSDEDHGTRPMHHFYDPVYKRGLTFGGEWQSSKEWSKDTLAQAGLLQRPTAGTINSLFSSDSDYSWERAIYDYVWEDKNRGLEGLGHILHLIQDATVPDHTRDDPHPSIFDESSPYEVYVRDKKLSTHTVGNPIILGSLGEYFEKTSNYSNNNFFSQDTIIVDKYEYPKYKILSNYILSNTGLEIAFVKKIKTLDKDNVVITNEYTLENKRVLENYWSLLSEQAVLNGAGVVKLFFDEVEKEKQTKELYKKNRSWFKRLYDKFEEKIFNTADSLYGITPEYDEFGDPVERATPNSNNKITATAFLQIPKQQKVETKVEQKVEEVKNIEFVIEEVVPTVSIEPEENFSVTNTGEEEVIQSNSNATPVEKVMTQAEIDAYNEEVTKYKPGFGGGGGGSSSVSTAPQSPTITSPSSFTSPFATTTITFSGTAQAGKIISQSFSTATTTSDGSGNWTIILSGLSQGSNSINFYATDGNQTSSATNVSPSVDTQAPGFDSFAITECSSSLHSSVCLLGSGGINLTWTSSSTDISSYAIYKDSVFQSNTTNTSASFTLANRDNSNFQIVATDTAGNKASSTIKNARYSTNTHNVSAIGYYCDPSTSDYTPLGYYTPNTSPGCYYSNYSLVAGAKYGDIFRGIVGSSTIIAGHSMGSSNFISVSGDNISSPVQGENIFVVIYRNYGSDHTTFRSYFQTGSGAVPHNDYGILQWKYGVAP